MNEYIMIQKPLVRTDGTTEGFVVERGEEIVRCMDCTNYATDELGDYCALLDFEDVKSMANGFCAWGIRKVNE